VYLNFPIGATSAATEDLVGQFERLEAEDVINFREGLPVASRFTRRRSIWPEIPTFAPLRFQSNHVSNTSLIAPPSCWNRVRR
jgi:hypothetical protein